MPFSRISSVSPGHRAGDLPEPDETARSHSRRLEAFIRREMDAAGGLLPFDRFMEAALYAPGLGYYVAGQRKLGEQGDFITAPEASPLFGRCLARQCADVLDELGGGDLLEFGAGSGALAADMLEEFARLERLPERYLILEPSPELRERQRQRAALLEPDLARRMLWIDALPKRFIGCVVANEVLDAMPVHRFAIQNGAVLEIFVCATDAGFEEVAAPPRSPALAGVVDDLRRRGLALGEGYRSEVNLRVGPWVRALAGALHAGAAFLIDYGYPESEYYLPERVMGTLMCHYRHRAHADPYCLVGLQDITAHVDFSAVARAGVGAGLALAGYANQAGFLLGCGLEQLLMQSDPDDIEAHMALVQGAKRLMMPSEMGERFQVLALERGIDRPLAGFSLRDLRERL